MDLSGAGIQNSDGLPENEDHGCSDQCQGSLVLHVRLEVCRSRKHYTEIIWGMTYSNRPSRWKVPGLKQLMNTYHAMAGAVTLGVQAVRRDQINYLPHCRIDAGIRAMMRDVLDNPA